MAKVIKFPSKPKKLDPWKKILKEHWPEEYDKNGDKREETKCGG